MVFTGLEGEKSVVRVFNGLEGFGLEVLGLQAFTGFRGFRPSARGF